MNFFIVLLMPHSSRPLVPAARTAAPGGGKTSRRTHSTAGASTWTKTTSPSSAMTVMLPMTTLTLLENSPTGPPGPLSTSAMTKNRSHKRRVVERKRRHTHERYRVGEAGQHQLHRPEERPSHLLLPLVADHRVPERRPKRRRRKRRYQDHRQQRPLLSYRPAPYTRGRIGTSPPSRRASSTAPTRRRAPPCTAAP